MGAEDRDRELHRKRQELREVKEKLLADETTREDKVALRERRKQLREEVNRLKSEPADTGEERTPARQAVAKRRYTKIFSRWLGS